MCLKKDIDIAQIMSFSIMSVPDEGYYERSWWRLFQKRVVRIKVDIYVFMDSKLLAIWEIKLYTSNNIKTTNMSKSNVYQVYLSCRLYAASHSISGMSYFHYWSPYCDCEKQNNNKRTVLFL